MDGQDKSRPRRASVSSATNRGHWLTLLVLVAFVLLTLTPAAAAVREAAAPPLTGDPAGLRLLRQANSSYAAVPGVRMDVAGGRFIGRYDLVMRNGVVVAEKAVVKYGADASTLVRPERQGTFVHDPAHDCWRPLSKNDPLELTDVGRPLLAGPGRVSRPVIGANTITIKVTSSGGFSVQVVLDKRTKHIRRYGIPGNVTRFTNLSKRPTLPSLQPRC